MIEYKGKSSYFAAQGSREIGVFAIDRGSHLARYNEISILKPLFI